MQLNKLFNRIADGDTFWYFVSQILVAGYNEQIGI